MANDVKRYMQNATLIEAVPAIVRLYPGATQYVLASDHDRIVSALTEAGRRLQALVDQLEHDLEIREEERKSLCGMIDGQNVRIAQHLEQIERLRNDAESLRRLLREAKEESGVEVLGSDMMERIDAALEASR